MCWKPIYIYIYIYSFFLIKDGSVAGVLKAKDFGDKCVFGHYPDMVHGWVPRADLTKEEGRRDVKEAMSRCLDFFKANL